MPLAISVSAALTSPPALHLHLAQLASLALFVYLFIYFASPLQPPSVHTGKRITLDPSVERIEVGVGESNKIIEHGEESHFPPAIPSLGRIIAGIPELG